MKKKEETPHSRWPRSQLPACGGQKPPGAGGRGGWGGEGREKPRGGIVIHQHLQGKLLEPQKQQRGGGYRVTGSSVGRQPFKFVSRLLLPPDGQNSKNISQIRLHVCLIFGWLFVPHVGSACLSFLPSPFYSLYCSHDYLFLSCKTGHISSSLTREWSPDSCRPSRAWFKRKVLQANHLWLPGVERDIPPWPLLYLVPFFLEAVSHFMDFIYLPDSPRLESPWGQDLCLSFISTTSAQYSTSLLNVFFIHSFITALISTPSRTITSLSLSMLLFPSLCFSSSPCLKCFPFSLFHSYYFF